MDIEQAKAILAAEPFVIVRLIINDEGYLDFDFEPILVATNVAWQANELARFVRDETNNQEEFGDLRSCQATYLWHIEQLPESYPNYGAYWEFVRGELLASEPFEIEKEGES